MGFRARGRFDIVCVFKDGAYVRFTSHKTRSLPPQEIAACLREYAGYIENGLMVEAAGEGDNDPASQPVDVRGSNDGG